jgi:predicted metal-dependent hydrolase
MDFFRFNSPFDHHPLWASGGARRRFAQGRVVSGSSTGSNGMTAPKKTHPKVRNVSFHFDENTPFQWNPANPLFGFAGNILSFVAPPFERYMVTTARQAIPRIADPQVAAEADAFLRQEAIHAREHRHHVAALTRQYPGLAEVSAEIERRFDRLVETESLEFHLAYAADIEATFTPLFNVWLRHRDSLFDNGDPRVAPLFLWHLVEEIEHRSSAYLLYNAVVADPWHRLRVLPRVFSHILGCATLACRGFDKHVPFEVRLAPASEVAMGWEELRAKLARVWRLTRESKDKPPYPSQFAAVPRMELVRMLYRLARSQHPRHSPTTEETPPFADEWMAEYDRGRDVIRWYGGTPS